MTLLSVLPALLALFGAIPNIGASGPSLPVALRPDTGIGTDALRQAQRRFEQFRRRRFPWTNPHSGRCDVRIGRFCIWLTGDDPAPPNGEDPEVIVARRRLIDALDSARYRDPANPWLAGQLVRYLVEGGFADEALAVTTPCTLAERWWCAALRGYALHADGHFAGAESAFTTAIAAMPDSLRCRWTDLSALLRGTLRKRYRRLPCADRDSLQALILRLADPLYAVPGNELYTAHLARHVYSRFTRGTETPSGNRWGDDSRLDVIRYGRPRWFEQVRPYGPGAAIPDVISHHPAHARYFLPTAKMVEHPSVVTAGDWDLDRRRPPAWHEAGAGLARIETIDYRVTRFYRGDSTILVADVTLRDDRIVPVDTVRGWLAVLRNPREPLQLSGRTLEGSTGRIAVRVPADSLLISLEFTTTPSARGDRIRYGIDAAPPADGGPAVSGLLLTSDSNTSTLRALVDANPIEDVAPGATVYLYWEMFVPDGRPIPGRLSVEVRRKGGGLGRRLLELTPFASRKPPVRLSWMEPVQPVHRLASRFVAVQLPGDLRNGHYVVTMQLDTAAYGRIVREAPLQVRRRD